MIWLTKLMLYWGSGEYYFSPSALIQLNKDNDIDDKYSSDEEFEEELPHSGRKPISSEYRSDSRSGHDFIEETNDIEYSGRLRENILEPPVIVSIV